MLFRFKSDNGCVFRSIVANRSDRIGRICGQEGTSQQKERIVRIKLRKAFAEDELGAVTIDFVVITAALLVLAVGGLSIVREGTSDSAGNVDRCMRIQGNLLSKDITYKKKLKRMANRCGRL